MTKQIFLRPLEKKDVENVMSWVNDPEVIGNFQNFNHPISKEEELTFIENITKSKNDKSFSILSEDGEYIGQIGLHQIHWSSRSGRIAIIIGNKNYWGKGYAQLALQKVLSLAFEEYNLHKIWIVTFETNKRMQHIMQKSGFQKEGFLRDEYFHKGKYHNMVRLSILEEDYKKTMEESK